MFKFLEMPGQQVGRQQGLLTEHPILEIHDVTGVPLFQLILKNFTFPEKLNQTMNAHIPIT